MRSIEKASRHLTIKISHIMIEIKNLNTIEGGRVIIIVNNVPT